MTIKFVWPSYMNVKKLSIQQSNNMLLEVWTTSSSTSGSQKQVHKFKLFILTPLISQIFGDIYMVNHLWSVEDELGHAFESVFDFKFMSWTYIVKLVESWRLSWIIICIWWSPHKITISKRDGVTFCELTLKCNDLIDRNWSTIT